MNPARARGGRDFSSVKALQNDSMREIEYVNTVFIPERNRIYPLDKL
jgi:hypothetical protein